MKYVGMVLGLIAVYLILSNGNAFNQILKTAGDTTVRGVTVLQGRDAKTAS